jgi:hypothetical protein
VLFFMVFRPCHSSGGKSPASHGCGPGLFPGQVVWHLWWIKWHWGRFSPSTSVSPANSYSTDYSTLIIYHPGLVLIGQILADVPSGLSLIPPKKKKRKWYFCFLPIDLQHQHRVESDVSRLISAQPGFF